MKTSFLLIALSTVGILAITGTSQASGNDYGHHGKQGYHDQSITSAYPPQNTWGIPEMIPPVAPMTPKMPVDIANAYEMPAAEQQGSAYMATQAAAPIAAQSGKIASETSNRATPAQTAPKTDTKSKIAQSTKHQVKIVGMTFEPATLKIKAGDIIEWTNESGMPHNVTSQGGASQFASATLSQNMTYALTFSEKGEYPYACTIHPAMQGSIIVE